MATIGQAGLSKLTINYIVGIYTPTNTYTPPPPPPTLQVLSAAARVANTDPHSFWKLDPDLHKNEKL
jgi:hypothetical protein